MSIILTLDRAPAIENQVMGTWAGILLLAGCMASVGCSAGGGRASDGGGGQGGSAGSVGMSGSGGAPVSDDGGAGTGGTADASGVGPPLDPQPVRIRGGDPNILYWDVHVSGEGLDSLEGRLVTVRIGSWPDGRVASGQARIVGGRFALDLLQGHGAQHYTQKTVLFDVDGDGRCSPGDAIWNDYSATADGPGFVERTFAPGQNGGIVFAVRGGSGGAPLSAPSAADCKRMDACNPYPARVGDRPAFLDALIRGQGFDAYEGRFVRLAARTVAEGGRLGSARAQIIGGTFTMRLPAGIPRQTATELLWFVDADGDDKCGASGGDLLGYATPGAFDPATNDPAAVSIDASALAGVPGSVDVCAAIAPLPTMTVTGTGFVANEANPIFVVTRMPSGATIGAVANHVSGGALSAMTFERRPGQEILWFADQLNDGICVTTDGAHTGAASTAGSAPAGNLSLTITDNHATTTASGADVCAVINGCL